MGIRLLATYKTFIKPIRTYCNAPLITVSKGDIDWNDYKIMHSVLLPVLSDHIY